MEIVGEHVETLKPYQPGKPIEELERELGISGSIKLASNENPLGPSPAAIREAAGRVHFYPDGGTYALREGLAAKHGVEMDEILVGNGSNEVLTLLARTFGTGGNAVISAYSFIAYRLVLQAANVPVKEIPTTDEFIQDLALMAKACNAETKLVFLANPNNPTGVYSSGEAMRDFLQRVPEHVIVVVDEAYFEYALADDYESALEMRDVRDRLVVTRTFSKCYGLAGLRVGYGIAPPPLVNYLNRVREPFNSNLVGQAAALAALDDTEHLGRSVQANEEGRALLEAGLQTLGLRWIPSQTNFLLVRMPKSGQAVYDAMLREGVIVRPVGGYGLPEWIRITIGTPEQTQRCVDALSTVLSA